MGYASMVWVVKVTVLVLVCVWVAVLVCNAVSCPPAGNVITRVCIVVTVSVEIIIPDVT